METKPSNLRPLCRVLLGLLVVWQLGFLGLSTLDVLVTGGPLPQDEPFDADAIASGESPGLYDDVPWLFRPARMWSKLTMQRQYWRLFPSFPQRSIFPAVTMVWHDSEDVGTTSSAVRISDYEPRDPDQKFALDYHAVRIFNYEQNIALVDIPWNDEDVQDEPDEYRQFRHQRLRSYWRIMHAYMRRELEAYRDEHPDAPTPDEVILEVRVIDTPAPDQRPWHYGPAKQRPLARWCPQRARSPGALPLDVYNPKSGEFETVAKNL